MKHVFTYVSVCMLAILFASCRQGSDGLEDAASQEESSIYVLRSEGDQPYYEMMSLPEEGTLPNNSASDIAYKNGNSAHTHGEFTGYGGGTTISFSGTENNGGPHGSAEIIRVKGALRAHFVLATSCVVVIGNEALYGGQITEVKENNIPPPPPPPPGVPPPACDPFELGAYVYFRVIDNGQGSNAPVDQYLGALISTCPGSPNATCYESFPWFIFSPLDVDNSTDNIKVN